MYDNTERLDAAIAKLTPNERADLLRAVDEWIEGRETARALEPLRSALLRARSESSASCTPERRPN
ncbi:MAG: hypothetical protein ABEN55_15740 [Bradymonadaceae bacterium]